MDTLSNQPGPVKESLLKQFLWPSWKQRKSALLTEAWVFLIVSYLLVAFSYLWPTDFRNTSPLYVRVTWVAFMVRVFLFHLGLFTVVITLVFVALRKWRLLVAYIPLLAITLGPACWPNSYQHEPAHQGDTVKVMSVNLLMVNETCAPIIAEIQAEEPDVLLLQEYTYHWHKALQEAIGVNYPYIIFQYQEDSFGTAVYSRHRFVGQATRSLPLGSADVPQIRAIIDIAGQKVAVYNIHLLPPRRLDYIIEQQTQWADLLDMLEKETLPVIVGGDFNFTEQTPHAAAITRIGFTDAHHMAGRGRGATWPVLGELRYVPGLRLDHIYLGRGLIAVDCQTGEGMGSDHRPVIVELR